jgi:hypothetical protein
MGFSEMGRRLCLLFCSLVLCGVVVRAQDNSVSHSSSSSGSNQNSDDASAKDDKQADQHDGRGEGQGNAQAPQGSTRLRLQVTGSGKPVSNASVYVRYNKSGGFLRKDKLAELDLKTNGDGIVKVPPVPQGSILIQVIATGWHTYGKWYDVNKDEDTIDIKLEPPTKWY